MADSEELGHQPLPGDVEDSILPEGAAGGQLHPSRGLQIPIVSTVESALDLPPNWQTGALPAPGG